MYDDMCEAITLYYEVMSAYEAAKKAKRGKKGRSAGSVDVKGVLLKVGSSAQIHRSTTNTLHLFSML